ncbi:MAG: YebC/PmpR family DNA-binding transcriptional regulator, partial [Calditrichaeota bacterium]
KVGVIQVLSAGVSEDELMLLALDAGADDVQNENEIFRVLTAPSSLEMVKITLEKGGIKIDSAEVTMEPSNIIKVEGKQAEQVLKLMDALEEQDDVQNVHSNFDIDEKIIDAFNN